MTIKVISGRNLRVWYTKKFLKQEQNPISVHENFKLIKSEKRYGKVNELTSHLKWGSSTGYNRYKQLNFLVTLSYWLLRR